MGLDNKEKIGKRATIKIQNKSGDETLQILIISCWLLINIIFVLFTRQRGRYSIFRKRKKACVTKQCTKLIFLILVFDHSNCLFSPKLMTSLSVFYFGNEDLGWLRYPNRNTHHPFSTKQKNDFPTAVFFFFSFVLVWCTFNHFYNG